MTKQLSRLNEEIIKCERCPRLVAWREQVAREKVKRFADQEYWGRPIPGFGDPEAGLLIVGLAPAAHGANRTGRMFTGDRSGDWLYRSLHKFGFGNQPTSVDRHDGLLLQNCYITASVHCAPPQNKPTTEEKNNCFDYLLQELRLLQKVRVVVALGKIGFDAIFKAYQKSKMTDLKSRPSFAHGAEAQLNASLTLIASYHPSQQNTFTGKLTEPMFDAIFAKAEKLLS